MKWLDYESYIEFCPPKEFKFDECLLFLNRSEQEIMHQIKDGCVYKAIRIKEELVLFKVVGTSYAIQIYFPMSNPSRDIREEVALYVWDWFHLEANLSVFYKEASHDKVLQSLVHKYYGLRIIGISDLFEALTWAIIGQQINLTFAFTLKKRFVESFGEYLTFEGETFWVYPKPERIANLDVECLRMLQFTSRKSEYIIGVAQAMITGELSKEGLLLQADYEQMKKSLMAIRGVGAWTADYVMMKCLYHPEAFPVADVGFHNALKKQLGMDRKPKIEEIMEITSTWQGWKAYAVFYLWRSLLDETA